MTSRYKSINADTSRFCSAIFYIFKLGFGRSRILSLPSTAPFKPPTAARQSSPLGVQMLDYARTHLYWTIPPATVLWLVGRRWRSNRDVFKICLLIFIAVTSTTPWDSFLIRNRIWTYPPESIAGWTMFDIPLEEVFFFIIQTYITSTLYGLLAKPVIHPFRLQARYSRSTRCMHWIGIAMLATTCFQAYQGLLLQGKSYYLSLILAWSTPFLLLLWTLAGPHILQLPLYASVLPICLPTAYLWLVDTVALRRGTWVIEAATKLEVHLWEGLDVEEAIFFLLTNVLIVFGLIACDFSFALHDAFPGEYTFRRHPTPLSIIIALLRPLSPQAQAKLKQYGAVQKILDDKSKSFSFAAVAFEGRLQLALPCLYAACRVADDCIDEAPSAEAVAARIEAMSTLLLDLSEKQSSNMDALDADAVQALQLYRQLGLPPSLFKELISGFEMDAQFSQGKLPITSKDVLDTYCERVASSVGEMCVRLAWQAHGTHLDQAAQAKAVDAARLMGRALQLVNIARDVPADMANGRVYIPATPLVPVSVTDIGDLTAARLRLLDEADRVAAESEAAIELLPRPVQIGMKAACRLYLEIGKQVRAELAQGRVLQRARTGKWQKLKVLIALTFR